MGLRWEDPTPRQRAWDAAVRDAHRAQGRPRWWWVVPGLVALAVAASLVGLLARAAGAW